MYRAAVSSHVEEITTDVFQWVLAALEEKERDG